MHVRPQDGLARHPPALLDRQRRLVEELGGAYREVVGARRRRRRSSTTARTLNATQIVLGATPPLALARADARLGDQPGDPRLGRRHRRPRDQPRDRRSRAPTEPARGRRRPRALPARGGCCSASCSPPLACRCSPAVLVRAARRTSGCRASCCSSCCSSSWSAAVGGALAGARGRRRRLPARQLVLHAAAPHVHDRRGREPPRARRVPRGRRHRQRLRRARRAARGRGRARSRRGRGARARSRASSLGRRRCSRACGARSGSTPRPSCTATATSWRLEQPSAEPRAGDARGCDATVELDDDHVLVAGRPARPADDDRPILERVRARARRRRSQLEELEAEASDAPAASPRRNELRTALLSAVSHDLRTPLAAIKASVTSLLQDDVEWTPDEHARVPRDDRRGDRPAQRARRQPARHEPAADRRARARIAQPSASTRSIPAALASLGAARREVDVDVPETLPRVARRPRPARAGARERRRRTPSAYSPARIASARRRRRGRRTASTCASSTAAPASRPPSASGCSCRSSGSATPAGDGVGLGLAVARASSRRWAATIEVEDTPGGGLTVVVRLRAAP